MEVADPAWAGSSLSGGQSEDPLRLLDLAKRLDQQVLVSRAVAWEVDQPLVDLVRHPLRDVEKPQRIFSLPEQGLV